LTLCILYTCGWVKSAQSTLSSNRLGALGVQAQYFGSCFYQALYDEFTGGSERQEIVAALVMHSSSAEKREIETALRTLLSISNKEALERIEENNSNNNNNSSSSNHHRQSSSSLNYKVNIQHFSSFLNTILDDVLKLTIEQQRIVFRLVFQSSLKLIIPSEGNLINNHSITHGNDDNNDGDDDGSPSSELKEVDANSIPVTIQAPDDVMILLKKYGDSKNKRYYYLL
jgi:hypothetical protein